MKSFNVVCGLPRSGSTLLCNLLNQNPDIYASSTSITPVIINSTSHIISNSPEFKSLLIRNRKETEDRVVATMRSIVETWYVGKPNVFDKSRVWSLSSLLLKQLFPESAIICIVRDLRSIFASIEKNHIKNPILDTAADIAGKTTYNRADELFSPGSLVGSAILGVEDLIRRKPDNLMIIRYEDFVVSPDKFIKEIYLRTKIKSFNHDFNNVKNSSEEVDGLWLNKFPHEGSGKIIISDTHEWKKYVSEDLATLIMDRYSFYNRSLNYL